jgi:serine/threonine-protein kinase
VTNQDVDAATTALENAGFVVEIVPEDTDDPGLEGVVLSQDPSAGTEAKPGTTVTITVGQLVTP